MNIVSMDATNCESSGETCLPKDEVVVTPVDPYQTGFLTLISPELTLSTYSACNEDTVTPIVHGYRIGGMANADAVGSYGVVVSASRFVEGTDAEEQYVAKFFGYSEMPPDMSWILREIDNLRHLRDVEGVAKIKGTFMDTPEGLINHIRPKLHPGVFPIIVMEKCDGGDLCARIISLRAHGHTFSEAVASKIFRSFMTALADIHTKNMINMDLKTENIVFKSKDPENLEVKIIDFGIATHLWDRDVHYESRPRGTPAFLAPESVTKTHEQYQYSRASDIWQAACILYIMIKMEFPFGGEDINDNPRTIRDRILDPIFTTQLARLDASELVKDLLIKMFQFDPKNRLTARQVLKHPWITNEAELSRADFGDDHKAKTMVKFTKYSLRGLLNRKLESAEKLLELCERRGRGYALSEPGSTRSTSSSSRTGSDESNHSNSNNTSTSASFGTPPPTARSLTNIMSPTSAGSAGTRKRSWDFESSSSTPIGNPLKLTRVESFGGHHHHGPKSRRTPISMSQFRKIRAFIIKEFKRTLPMGQQMCPRRPLFVSKLFEFVGIDFAQFRDFLRQDEELYNLQFLGEDEALALLDSDHNGKIDYFEFMLGLGPLVAHNHHSSHQNQHQDGVFLRRSSSYDEGMVGAHYNNNPSSYELSLDPEVYFEIFNIYQTGIIYPLVIIHGLSYMLPKESMIEQVIRGYNLSENGLKKDEFIKFFSVVLENTKSARTF